MRNLTLMTDLYQLTMMNGFLKQGMEGNTAVYDMFFRKSAGDSTYSVFAGLEQLLEYIENLEFTDDDLKYLSGLALFDKNFVDYLASFRFSGDILSCREGDIVFANEPLIRVSAPIIEAQLIESALLNIINHQTLIATKASRVRYASYGGELLEFGLRRAQGPDAAIYGTRAAIIGGADATSNVLGAKLFGVPARGTHAHSWVMSFPSELDSFRAYAKTYPDSCLLLVDTYDTLKSGVPNAIKVFSELAAIGKKPLGIRLDSGDLAYLSKKSREMLDEAGFTETKICASSDLDEEVIADLKIQGAKIDIWGVGTKLITSENCPALGGVYKLSALEKDGKITPKIKISDNIAKITNPGLKKFVRLYGEDKKAVADLIMLADENINASVPLTIFDPVETWKKMTLTNFSFREILIPVMERGARCYESPQVKQIREYSSEQLAMFWDEYLRLNRPHIYKVDLSDKLYDLKKQMLSNYGNK